MSSPEERSEQLDDKLMLITVKRHRVIYAFMVVLIVFMVGQFLVLVDLARNNHSVLTAQIPGLKSQIADRDQEIGDYKVTQSEAVSAIEKLAKQVIRLGGNPGQIVIKPPVHKEK